MSERGKFIIIEGTDGTGKTTVANLVAEQMRRDGDEVIRVDEPASAQNADHDILVPISDEIRTVLKDGTLGRTALTELLLFSASRRENWLQASLPALNRGAHVVGSRFWWSTLAYQGYGDGLDRDMIAELTRLSTDEEYLYPDHAFILDLDDEDERARRIGNRGELAKPDAFEKRGPLYQQRVLDGYRTLAQSYGMKVISATQPPEVIAQQLLARIAAGDRGY